LLAREAVPPGFAARGAGKAPSRTGAAFFYSFTINQKGFYIMSDASKPNLETPKIEQVSEYRDSTRTGSQPPPPDAARALKGTQTIEGIREATEARRQQSNSWSTRDVGPEPLANRDSKRK
jgi:hypothetical protein